MHRYLVLYGYPPNASYWIGLFICSILSGGLHICQKSHQADQVYGRNNYSLYSNKWEWKTGFHFPIPLPQIATYLYYAKYAYSNAYKRISWGTGWEWGREWKSTLYNPFSVRPPPRSATFFRGDWSWNIFYGHSLPSADSRRAVVSFWRKNVHNTG